MKSHFLPLVRWTTWLLVAGGLLHGSIAAGQPIASDDWQAVVQARLRGIYEQGQWRAKRFDGQWLPRSSGFVMTKRSADGSDQRVLYEVATGQTSPAPDREPPNPRLSPDGLRVLENRGRNWVIRTLADDALQQVTPDAPQRDVFYRQPQWSPDGERILYIAADETDVRRRKVLVPSDPSYPDVRENRFARVGESIPQLRVGVFNRSSGETQWLPIETPEEGFYLGQVEWAGNSREVLIETLSRFRDRREFYLVDVVTNQSINIYSETNDAWAISSHTNNLGLNWIDGGQRFIVVSEQDGWRQAFLYARSGERLGKLTPGNYDIIDRATIDEAGGWFYFYASPDDATQKYLHRVPLDGSGTLTRVTPAEQPGTHDYVFSPDARYAFHTYSTFDTPPVTTLVQLPEHRVLCALEDNSELMQKTAVLRANPTEFLQLDIGDGVTLDAWMMKPSDFDPSKKYPVFVYVYGEPHAQTVLDGWATVHDQFHRTVADLGYLVISIDNRGTPAPKGAAWRRSVFGSLGPLSTEEQAAAVQEFGRTRPYVDLTRVGIWGWSGGGSNTLNALFRQPDVYQVGIAVVPKPQPHLYNAWFQEIYMRTREVNPEGYETAAAINYAAGLQGKLLIITGSGETNTHIQIIEGLVDRLIELGKPFDYWVYPNRDHGLQEGPGTVVHVRMLVIRYLVENLPRGGRDGAKPIEAAELSN
jgi:dipeptidyl-peptidase-4